MALEEPTLLSLFYKIQMNTSDLEAGGDMLLARDNLSSLAMAEDEAVTLRLTNYLVPAAFGLILTLGLLGNFMVIGVVSFVNIRSVNNLCSFPIITQILLFTGLPKPSDSEHDQLVNSEPGSG